MKNKNKGFSLIEMVTVVAIVVLISTLTVTSLSAISSTRLKKYAEEIKSKLEIARNYARTHGSTSSFIIEKTDDGFTLSVTDESDVKIEDATSVIYYRETDTDVDKILSTGEKLEIDFLQTHGIMIGPDYIDYLILANGDKTYKLVFQQQSGMVYYDYEFDSVSNEVPEDKISVSEPRFINGLGEYTTNITLTENIQEDGTYTTLQPVIDYESAYIKIGGTFRAQEAGTYIITFTLKNKSQMYWSDGTQDDKILTWKIQEA